MPEVVNPVAGVPARTQVAGMELVSPMIRCFVGVRPTGAAVEALRALGDRLQAVGGGAVRWHPCEKWHVTLCFLGEQPADLLTVFDAAVAQACLSTAPIRLEAGGLNLWPSPRRARVVSLKIAGAVAALAGLQKDLSERLRPYLPKADYPFRPHLTLGYVRRGGVVGSEARQQLQQLTVGPLAEWTVASVELMEGGGATRTLASFGLALRGPD